MRMQASSGRDKSRNLFQDDCCGVNKLMLTADIDFDRQLLTSLFVLKGISAYTDPELYAKARTFMQQWIASFQ